MTEDLAVAAKAHAERAEYARHGAGQLSLSAQRAPTREACDDGWRRVDSIVAGAEASARAAEIVVARLDELSPRGPSARAARTAASRAAAAARDARKIVDRRNDAYTFHVDGGFSFGEGWHVAAAGVLGGVTIQVEPGKPATSQAEAFLHAAGLGSQLREYRSRPCAMKQTSEVVARAFRAGPAAAQRKLRQAFLGTTPPPKSLVGWVDRRLEGAPEGRRVLLWVRSGAHDAFRNTTSAELAELVRRVEEVRLVPVLTGDPLEDVSVPHAVDLTGFWTDPLFHARRAQLQLFEHLRTAHGLIGQLGVTTAGMDGPALMGLPTAYLTDIPNVRMRQWVGAVPGYREISRAPRYLEDVSATLREWVAAYGEPSSAGHQRRPIEHHSSLVATTAEA